MRMPKRAIKAAVSVAFFYVLYRWVRGYDFASVLHNFRPLYFVLSLLIVPVMLSTSCAKWKVLLDAQGCRVSFLELIRFYMIGYFFSNILPSNVGGDIVRLFYAGHRVGSHGHAAASIFLERFTGILLLLALVVGAPLLRPSLYGYPAVWIPALGAGVLLAAFLLMLRMKNPFTWIFSRLAGLVRRSLGGVLPARIPALRKALLKTEALFQRMIRKAESFHDKLALGVHALRTSRLVWWKVVVLTFLFYMLAGVNVYLAFATFGPAPDLASVISVLPTAMIVAMVPVTLGSLGIAETSYVYFFHLLAMSPANTAAMALFLRLKLILLGLLGFVVYLTHKGERFRRSAAPEEA